MRHFSLVLLLLASSAFGAQRTWTGTTNGQWTLASNWGGTAPVAGDDLQFPAGAQNLNNSNDFLGGTVFNSIAITGGGYVLNGNPIVLSSGVSNDFTGTSTINLPIQLGASIFTWPVNQVNGALVIAGSIDLNGREMAVTPNPGSVTISGAISGGGPSVSILKGDIGDLTLSGNNTFTGQVLVAGSGRLLVSGANALGVADNTPANGTVVNTGASLAIVGVTIPNEYIRVSGALLQSPLAGGAINGTVDLTGGGVGVVTPGTLTFNGLLTGGFFDSLIISGNGTVTINSSGNNFGGLSWATGINTTTLRLGADNALLSTVHIDVPAGALFDLNGKTQSINSLTGAGNVSLGSGGILTITAGLGTFSGGVSGNGTVVLSALTDTWTGANTYTGSFSLVSGEFDLIGGSLSAPLTQTGGTLSIASNATAGAVTVNGGVFWPGRNGTAFANTGNLTLTPAAMYREFIDGPLPGSFALTHVNGTVNLGGATLGFDGNGSGIAAGNTLTIIDNDGSDPVIGTFNGLPEGAIIANGPGGFSYRISYAGGTGNDVVLTALAPGAIPALDPRALIALAFALAVIALFTLRR